MTRNEEALKFSLRYIYVAWFSAIALPSLALDGGTLRINTFNEWRAFEVISQSNNPQNDGFNYSMPSIFDGAGAWLVGSDTLRVLINHETNDASISEVDLNISMLKKAVENTIETGSTGNVKFVKSARQAYDRWSGNAGTSWLTTNDTQNTSFRRFCSGQSYAPNTFGENQGFVDELYITGEEISGGRLFVVDSVKRDLYLLSGITGSSIGGIGGMPFDAWENAALIDTGESDHIALLLSPDGGTRNLRLYIGEKNKDTDGSPSSSFLARNGLAFGSWYFLKGAFPELNATNTGSFDTNVSGVLSSDKLEDVDTSPSSPTRAVLADQTSGVFTFDFALAFNGSSNAEGSAHAAGSFNAEGSSFSITQIADNSGSLNTVNSPDNIEWTLPTSVAGVEYLDGLIFVNEDNSSGEIWQMTPDGNDRVLIGNTAISAESTGIIDISAMLGYTPASILLTNNQGLPSSSTVLISPTASIAEAVLSPLAQCELASSQLEVSNLALLETVGQLDVERDICNAELSIAQDKSIALALENTELTAEVSALQAAIEELENAKDTDGDGVSDSADQCPNTSRWARKVSVNGCSRYQRYVRHINYYKKKFKYYYR